MIDYRLNINNKYNLINYEKCRKLINNNKIELLDSGKQAEIFKVFSNDCGSVIIKVPGKNTYNDRVNNAIFKKLILENIFFLRTNKLIKENICPNFVERIDFIKEKKYLIFEYADGDCKKLLKNEINFPLLYSLILQVLMGILSLNKILKIVHRDLHLGNILYKKIKPEIIFCYIVNEKKYYVKTYGYLFMIADFGNSAEIDYLKKNNQIINENIDVGFFTSKINNKIKNKELSFSLFNKNKYEKEIIELYNILKNKNTIFELLENIYNKYKFIDNSNNSNNICYFSINI